MIGSRSLRSYPFEEKMGPNRVSKFFFGHFWKFFKKSNLRNPIFFGLGFDDAGLPPRDASLPPRDGRVGQSKIVVIYEGSAQERFGPRNLRRLEKNQPRSRKLRGSKRSWAETS